MLPTIAAAEPVSECVCMWAVCTSLYMRLVSEKACVLRGRNMNQFKSISYTEMTYLCNLLQYSILLWNAQEFTRLLIEIIATGRT